MPQQSPDSARTPTHPLPFSSQLLFPERNEPVGVPARESNFLVSELRCAANFSRCSPTRVKHFPRTCRIQGVGVNQRRTERKVECETTSHRLRRLRMCRRCLQDLRAAGLPPELDAKMLTVADVWIPADPHPEPPAYPDLRSKTILRAHAAALDALKQAQATAEEGRAQLQKLFPKWRVHRLAVADSPAWAIARVAREFHADLIVVGSHGALCWSASSWGALRKRSPPKRTAPSASASRGHPIQPQPGIFL